MTHTLKNTFKHPSKHPFKHTLLGAVVVLVMVVMGGCNFLNPTPELLTTARTSGQQNNKFIRVTDNNIRGIWDDLDRIMFFEHTLRLTPYPVP